VYGLVGVIVNVSSCMPNPSGPLHVIWPKSKPGVVASGFCCALSLTGHAIVSAFFMASPRRQLRLMRMRALPTVASAVAAPIDLNTPFTVAPWV